jgi:hypothetical protein
MNATAKSITRNPARAGDYTMVDPRRHAAVLPCCVCGSKPQVWRYQESKDSSTVAVCCVNAEGFQDTDPSLFGAGCLLYMPPRNFYRARIVEAVEYWNAYQRAALAMRGA